MKNDPGAALCEGPCRSFGVVLAIFWEFAIAPRAYAATWNFEPGVELIQSYFRSTTFSRSKGWTSSNEAATQANPIVHIDGKSQRVSASMDYLMRNQYFLNDAQDSYSRYHQLYGRVHAVLLKDTFYVDGAGSLTQVFVAGNQGITRSELITTQNRTDAAVASISPVLQWRLGKEVRSTLQYSRDRVRYKGGDFGDSDGQVINLTLYNDDDAARLRWSIVGRRTNIDYVTQHTFLYRDYEADMSYRISGAYGLLGRGGYEDYEFLDGQTTTNPRKQKWNLGAYWSPLRRVYLEALFGRHYYGNAYSGILRLAGKRTEWSAEYNEETFSTRQELLERTTQRGDTNGVSDTASLSLPVFNEDIYVRKRAQLVATRNQRKGFSSARLFYDTRDFQTSPGFDHAAGGEFIVEHKTTPHLLTRVTLYGTINRYKNDSNSEYWDAELLNGYKARRTYEFTFVVRYEQRNSTNLSDRARSVLASLGLHAQW